MQIKNDATRSDQNARAESAPAQRKTAKNTTGATGSSTFSRVARALAVGVLTAPGAVAARTLQNDAAVALPGSMAQALTFPAQLLPGRRLLQACDCAITSSANNAYFAAGADYTNITMLPHFAHGNSVALTAWGSTVDIYGLTTSDNVGPSLTDAIDVHWQSNPTGDGTTLLFVPHNELMSSSNPDRIYVNLHGFNFYTQFNGNKTLTWAMQGSAFTDCTTQVSGASAVRGQSICASPPPPPPAPIFVPSFSSPPPPRPPIFVPSFSSPPPASPPPPSPIIFSMSPPPPAPPHGGGSSAGLGAAIGGIAGGAVVLGAGGYYGYRAFKKRREARMAERENNVEMGAPQAPPTVPPGPHPAESAPGETDFEFTV